MFEIAARLGGTLYSEHRNVKTVKVRLSLDHLPGQSKYVFESSTITSHSEHPSQLFEKYNLNETTGILPGVTEADQSAIIWITDEPAYSESEIYTSNLFGFGISNTTRQPLRFRILLGRHAHEYGYDDGVTHFQIEDYKVLGTLGGTLFPGICKGM